MERFKIEYQDPATGNVLTTVEDFASTKNITAREWAEDLAYTLADKGWHKVTEMSK